MFWCQSSEYAISVVSKRISRRAASMAVGKSAKSLPSTFSDDFKPFKELDEM